MRRAVLFIALAACEIQPAPKKQAVPVEVPAQPAQPVQPTQPPTPPPAPADGGLMDNAAAQVIQASAPCINVAAHVVQVFIETAKDQASAAVYEQERMKMTKATAEACEKQGWSEAAQTCYLAAKSPTAIKACENKFPPSPPGRENGPGQVAPTGRGSGAGTGSATEQRNPRPPAGNPGSGVTLRPGAAKGSGAGSAH